MGLLTMFLRRSAAPILAIDDGFSGSGVLHGTAPDTVGSPKTWQVVGNGNIVRSGGTATLAANGSSAEAIIDHGTDVAEIIATVNLGPDASGSNTKRAGVVFGSDPARSTSTHYLCGEYTAWLRYEPSFKALHLIYSPDLSTTPVLAASWSFTASASTDYEIKVVVDGTTLRVYLDGTERITYDATGTLNNMRYAGVSLSSSGGLGLPRADRYRGWV